MPTIPSILTLLTDDSVSREEKIEIIDLLLLLGTNDNIDELLDLRASFKPPVCVQRKQSEGDASLPENQEKK